MKKGLRFNLILCILLLCLACFVAACSNNEEEVPDIASIDISLTINYPEKSKAVDIKNVSFKIEEETTVLQAIQLYGNVNNISVLVDTTHSTLEGINGIINGVDTKNNVWKFKLNGKYVSASESEKLLEDGDSLEFLYVKR